MSNVIWYKDVINSCADEMSAYMSYGERPPQYLTDRMGQLELWLKVEMDLAGVSIDETLTDEDYSNEEDSGDDLEDE